MKVLMVERSDIYCDTRVQKEATSLAEHGYEVSVVGLRSSWRPRALETGYDLITFPVISRRFRILRNLHLMLLVVLINLLVILRRADYYHAHNTMFLFGMWISARLHRGVLIYDSHEVQWEMDRASEFLEKTFINKTDCIINVSQGRAEKQSERYNYPLDRITVVSNYPPLTEHAPELPATDDKKIRFIYSGGFSLVDNRLDHFIEALADFPAMDFSLLSFGYGDSFEQLSRKIEELQLQDRVRFLPLVNPSEVLGLISRFDFAVNMLTNPKNWVSYQHPAINKIYEYLGAGLPVLCSTLPAFERELVAPGVGVAVDATNPAAIKQGLQHILDNRAAISEMKTKALHLARTKYNWQSEEKILLKLYETLGRSRCFVPNSPAAIPS